MALQAPHRQRLAYTAEACPTGPTVAMARMLPRLPATAAASAEIAPLPAAAGVALAAAMAAVVHCPLMYRCVYWEGLCTLQLN